MQRGSDNQERRCLGSSSSSSIPFQKLFSLSLEREAPSSSCRSRSSNWVPLLHRRRRRRRLHFLFVDVVVFQSWRAFLLCSSPFRCFLLLLMMMTMMMKRKRTKSPSSLSYEKTPPFRSVLRQIKGLFCWHFIPACCASCVSRGELFCFL